LLKNYAVTISQDNGQQTRRPAKTRATLVRKKRSEKGINLVGIPLENFVEHSLVFLLRIEV
jgi:hypothetical protein